MKRVCLFHAIIFTLCLNSIGQKEDSLSLITIDYRWVVFAESDRFYNFTLFTEPDGKFYFRSGHVDKDYSVDRRLYKIENNNLIVKYDLYYKLGSELVDTIHSYFPINYLEESAKQPDSIYITLYGSFILREFNEQPLLKSDDNSIRILYPCDDFNFSKKYFVFTISFYEDSAEIHVASGHFNDLIGLTITKKKSAKLIERDIKRIKKQLKKMGSIEYSKCLEPGNPWYLETNINNEYNFFLISNYCVRGKRAFKPIKSFSLSFLRIGLKYFSIDCNAD